jgi:hypothetical protein
MGNFKGLALLPEDGQFPYGYFGTFRIRVTFSLCFFPETGERIGLGTQLFSGHFQLGGNTVIFSAEGGQFLLCKHKLIIKLVNE